MRIEQEAVLRAPADRVWAVLSDWERQASWMPDVAWMRLRGPERELGARLAVRTKVLGIPAATDVITVTAWEPPTRLAVVHSGVVKGTGEWLLTPLRSGGATALRWVEDFTMPPPVLGELALRCYAPVQRLMQRRSLANLRRLVEQVGR
jgi:carbon monoxide dehydrogenase subunit G